MKGRSGISMNLRDNEPNPEEGLLKKKKKHGEEHEDSKKETKSQNNQSLHQ
jgi:hypothetical protein